MYLYLILISLVSIAGLIAFKAYEERSGVSFWRLFKVEKLQNLIEDRAERLMSRIHKIDSKIIISYSKEFAIIILQFYRALQKISADRFARLGQMHLYHNGNRAASFYLKSIREKKEESGATRETEIMPE